MKKTDSLKLLGKPGNKIAQKPEIEHLMFYQFLLVSKSYEIAHQIRSNKLAKSETVPLDIDKVLRIYDLVGNIYSKPFEIWWESKGHQLFKEKTPISRLTINLDLRKSKAELLREVGDAISKGKESSGSKSDNLIEFTVNKIRPSSLFHKLQLVEEKAAMFREGAKQIPNWKVGLNVNFGSKHITRLNKGIKDTHEANKTREYLGKFVCQKLLEANWIAENAARGEFPLEQAIDSGLNFDYQKLSKIIYDQNISVIEEMCENLSRDNSSRQWDYSSVLIKGINKQRAKNKRILAKAKQISESKSMLYKLD